MYCFFEAQPASCDFACVKLKQQLYCIHDYILYIEKASGCHGFSCEFSSDHCDD